MPRHAALEQLFWPPTVCGLLWLTCCPPAPSSACERLPAQDYIQPFDWRKVPKELQSIPHRGQASVFNFSFELQDYTGGCSGPHDTA